MGRSLQRRPGGVAKSSLAEGSVDASAPARFNPAPPAKAEGEGVRLEPGLIRRTHSAFVSVQKWGAERALRDAALALLDAGASAEHVQFVCGYTTQGMRRLLVRRGFRSAADNYPAPALAEAAALERAA